MAVHRTDAYLPVPIGDKTLELWFFWNPLDGGVDEIDRSILPYSGPRIRKALLKDLSTEKIDFVITGALEFKGEGISGYDHHVLYEYFNQSAILLNHRIHWYTEPSDIEVSQLHGIATVDSGSNATDYYYHLDQSEIVSQTTLLGMGLKHYFPV